MTQGMEEIDVNAAVVDVVATVQHVANRLKRGPDDVTIEMLVQHLEASAGKLNRLMQQSTRLNPA